MALFCPSETLLLIPRVATPQSAVQLRLRGHSQSRGNGRAPGSSEFIKNPSSSSRSKGKTVPVASISCPLRSPEKSQCDPSLSQSPQVSASYTWNQTFAFLLWYHTHTNTTHNPKEKWRQRNINRKEHFVFKKENWYFPFSGPLSNPLHQFHSYSN